MTPHISRGCSGFGQLGIRQVARVLSHLLLPRCPNHNLVITRVTYSCALTTTVMPLGTPSVAHTHWVHDVVATLNQRHDIRPTSTYHSATSSSVILYLSKTVHPLSHNQIDFFHSWNNLSQTNTTTCKLFVCRLTPKNWTFIRHREQLVCFCEIQTPTFLRYTVHVGEALFKYKCTFQISFKTWMVNENIGSLINCSFMQFSLFYTPFISNLNC